MNRALRVFVGLILAWLGLGLCWAAVASEAHPTSPLLVDPSTGFFGVRSQDGTIRTFFRPYGDPVAYFWGLQ